MKPVRSVFAPAALQTFCVATVLSIVHRLMAFRDLANGIPLFSEVGLQAVLVAFWSDLWIAILIGTLVGLVALLLEALGRQRAISYLPPLVGSLLALLLAAHQAYVSFFHFAIIPYHLSYLGDWRFLQANSASLFEWHSLLLLAFGLTVAWSAPQLARWRPRRTYARLSYTLLVCLCLLAHYLNIRYRVSWFIPENLQVNPAERLYIRYLTDTLPAPLAASERQWLEQILHAPSTPAGSPPTEDTRSALFRMITHHSDDSEDVEDVGRALKTEFAAALIARQKPIAMILLLESQRPSETGYFAPDAGPSLTPNIDALAAKGIAFKRAYSTGSVTRGAQEAVFCGYLGSRSTSLMRGEAVMRTACLPDLATTVPNRLGARGETFWYHGGDPRFDNQEAYWRRHAVHDFLDSTAFPESAPHTGWGVSDKQFLAAAAQHLVALHASTSADYLLGMGLTVTNHIPWSIPEDAGAEVNAPRAQGHGSYKTSAYTDAAIGAFVEEMKAQGLWDSMLLVLASDHGNDIPPLVDLYPTASAGNKSVPLESHINLIVTGGLTDKAIKSLAAPLPIHKDTVSQADIAAFIAYAVDLPGSQFMAENLFVKHKQMPVLSNLEEVLVDQNTGRAFKPAELTGAGAAPVADGERKSLLYYRAFLQYIYTPDQH